MFLAGDQKVGETALKLGALTCLVCVALLVPVTVFGQAKASNATKIKQAQGKLKDIRTDKKEIQKKIGQVKDQREEVREELGWVNGRIRRINDGIKSTKDLLDSRRAEQDKAKRALLEASNKMKATRERLKNRVASIYRQGQTPAAMLLMGSADAGALAARKAFVERIAQRDRQLFEEVKERRQAVEKRKVAVDGLVTEVRELETKMRSEQARLMVAQQDKQAIIKGLNQQESRLESEMDELDAESNKLAASIASYQNASRPGSRSFVAAFGGGLIRPAQGRLSSGFGMRVHPISRRRRLHAGIDIAAPTGTPIIAAAPGVVIFSGWRGGYGNAVIIDHGGGLSTLYGHCSRLLVKSGQRVKQGQRIALMGSTGYSTGPHLHFETRINGKPVNPLSRL
jgi:murein DD-endopeptidase MepM/ murein hydrolase activator NlpD